MIGGPIHRSRWLYFSGKWETPELMDKWQSDSKYKPMQEAAQSRWFASVYSSLITPETTPTSFPTDPRTAPSSFPIKHLTAIKWIDCSTFQPIISRWLSKRPAKW